jgi:hypothetical protein
VKQVASRALLDLFFDPEDGWMHVSLKRRLTFNGLHGVISQKIEILITTTTSSLGGTVRLVERNFMC